MPKSKHMWKDETNLIGNTMTRRKYIVVLKSIDVCFSSLKMTVFYTSILCFFSSHSIKIPVLGIWVLLEGEQRSIWSRILLLRILEFVPFAVEMREIDVRFDSAVFVDRKFSIRFQKNVRAFCRRRRPCGSSKTVVTGTK